MENINLISNVLFRFINNRFFNNFSIEFFFKFEVTSYLHSNFDYPDNWTANLNFVEVKSNRN